MGSIIQSINHLLSVKACTIDLLSFRSDKPILSYLKPGRLEKITIVSAHDKNWSEYSETLDQIALLDQWKQAKELEVFYGLEEEEDFPVEHVTHFKQFHFVEDSLYTETVVLVRDLISEHENIEFCTISTREDPFWLFGVLPEEELDDMMGTLVSPNLYHYTIPDSEYYLELLFSDCRLTIEKKNK